MSSKNEGYIDKNLILRVKPEKKEVIVINKKHIEEIKDYFVKDRLHSFYFFSFLLVTGFRKGEAVNAHWEDVNLKERILSVRNTKKNRIDKIPLLNETLELLKLIGIKENGKIFNYKCAGGFDATWNTMRKRLGFKYKIHEIRKTCGTIL
ncbi:MAG: tyrosine-type recombinase/integrase, partial [Labilibaculum sp.]|nr:tyrosine-type recombinase/integrase [Labilibaculum sp.]